MRPPGRLGKVDGAVFDPWLFARSIGLAQRGDGVLGARPRQEDEIMATVRSNGAQRAGAALLPSLFAALLLSLTASASVTRNTRPLSDWRTSRTRIGFTRSDSRCQRPGESRSAGTDGGSEIVTSVTAASRTSPA